MPMGKGTYGSKVGRPKKKRKDMMDGGMMSGSNPRKKKGTGGRMMYTDGGLVDFKNPN